MATDLVEINAEDPQPEALELAAAAIRRGKVVAIPTDALYTLVADPFNLRAVTGVFHAKGREVHRSLPILIRDTMMAEELAKQPPEPLPNRVTIPVAAFLQLWEQATAAPLLPYVVNESEAH